MADGEFAIIQKYFAKLGASNESLGVALGIGDDAAILNVSPGTQLVAAADTLVAGVHFPADTAGDNVASRAMRTNLSDMAAMAARPRWFTLALTLTEANPVWLEAFSRTLSEDAAAFNSVLVGGDTTKGPLTVSIQMLGEVPTGAGLTRGGASVGDQIYITGTLGAAAAALNYLTKATPDALEQQLLERYYRPVPRINEALQLRQIASAAIDISDGLLADLGHIAAASGLGANLEIEKVPLFPGLAERIGKARALACALMGGDDYELCFTAPASKQQHLQPLLNSGAITQVGEMTAGLGVTCLDERGRPITPDIFGDQQGYQHF